VGKNEVIKIKGVNQYDVDYLGYSSQDLNTVVWAEPLPIEDVVAKLNATGADAATRKIVLERHTLREKEWVDPKINHLIDESKTSGRIDWGFNGTDNEAPGANKAGSRLFGLKPQPNPVKALGKDRTYEQILVGNKPDNAGRLVPVTQDVDLMAILSANGSILSASERTQAYIHLSDVLGIEHPETPTWVKDGEIMFQAKAKQLADVTTGGEPLAVVSPTGSVTAGFFNSALTIFDSVTHGGRIFFEGGYNDPYSLLQTKIQLALKGMG